jgi:hypothetical protein
MKTKKQNPKFICAKCCGSVLISTSDANDLEELRRRVMLAEDILSDLATGYWHCVLNQMDNPVGKQMGERVLDYWRTLTDDN